MKNRGGVEIHFVAFMPLVSILYRSRDSLEFSREMENKKYTSVSLYLALYVTFFYV